MPTFLFTCISRPIFLQVWAPSNPRGAESLPPKIVVSESDLYARRLWGNPSEVCTCKLPSLNSSNTPR